MMRCRVYWAAAGWLVATAIAAGDERGEWFDRELAPVLMRSCLECHGGLDPEAGLDLSSRAGFERGGESGAVFDASDPEGSLIWQKVRDGEMPPEEELSAAEKNILLEWLRDGAAWGADPIDLFRFTTGKRAGYDWWSLQPLSSPEIPAAGADRAHHPIDRFVSARLQDQAIAASGEATRAVLIRRLSFDLLGLPPTPERVREFVADDRPDAYERLVEELLASPHYGIRWGRHWLDVARFGESQGFERDKLREDSWPYRDWVVEALNRDLPYNEFVRLQLAGDVIPDAGIEGVIATGFLVAGPWDEVGQSQQSAAMKAVVRQDELEDYASVVGQTFLGLTVHCARCHDHKFDPIRQEEYYRLTSALDGVHHGSRNLMTPDAETRKSQLAEQLRQRAAEVIALDGAARERVLASREGSTRAAVALATPIARWTFTESFDADGGGLAGTPHSTVSLEEGQARVGVDGGFIATAPLTRDLTEKTLEVWVRLDTLEQGGGGVMTLQTLDGVTFDSIVFAEREPQRWMAGSNGYVRTQPFGGLEELEAADRIVQLAITWSADGTIAAYRDGLPYGVPYKSTGPVTYESGKSQIVFGLRHLPAGGDRHLRGRIDSAQLYDRALTAAEIAASAQSGPTGITTEELLAALSPAEQARRAELIAEQLGLQQQYDAIQPLSAYVVAASNPAAHHVLLRGNPATPGHEVTPGGLTAIPGRNADFGQSTSTSDGERRRALADWITADGNPLFSRVLVNRVWHHHFGTGLVATTSDLGYNGGQPSHPELLDWLAGEFVRGGYSLKHLHRLLVTSATYRQASTFNHDAAAIDADNRLLWRMSPRRMEAENLRDTVLAVADQLNTEMRGPGYRDFETFTKNSQFYTVTDPDAPEFYKRTIYRTGIRSGRSTLLDVFDCPDPSTNTPSRAVTVTPLQALSLLNNSFILRMSGRLADRVRSDAGEDVDRQVARAMELAYGREPTAEESAVYAAFVKQHGLPEFCRIVLNSSEFLYVD
jgi:hypothetical protein